MSGDHVWLARNKRGWSPGLYEGWFTHNLFQAAIRAKEQEAFFGGLLRAVRIDHDVLELGPGTGLYTVPLAGACRSVVAIDSSSAMLEHLSRRLADASAANVEARLGCATELGPPATTYDGFLAAGVFNYLPDLPRVLRDLTDRLRPGGWAVFSVPLSGFGGRVYRATERISGHRVWTYDPAEITRLSSAAGLEVSRLGRAGMSRAGMTLVVEARRA